MGQLISNHHVSSYETIVKTRKLKEEKGLRGKRDASTGISIGKKKITMKPEIPVASPVDSLHQALETVERCLVTRLMPGQ
jgi:hypothetical protein